MSYYFSKTVTKDFDVVIENVTSALQKEGFGVLADINIQDTLKNKLGVDFRKYRVLGACNPPFALRALETENKIGTMLPCNVVVQETADGKVEIAAINPVQSMISVENRQLHEITIEIGVKLQKVIDTL